MIKILYFCDPIGSMDFPPEKEAKLCKTFFKDFIFEDKEFKFSHTINSMKIQETGYDILVFDFGGLTFGSSGIVNSLSRQISNLIKTRNNTLFICWSSITSTYLRDECDMELGQYENLIIKSYETKEVIKEIKKWLKYNTKEKS